MNGALRSSPTPNLEELKLVQHETHHNCAELYLRKMFANGECVQLRKDRRDAEAVFMRINEDRKAAEVALARINDDCRVAETAFSRVDDDWRAAEDRLRELEVAYIEAEAEFEAAAKRYAAAKRQAEAEAERLAAERLAAERVEAERLEAERVEAERVAAATRIQALARSFVLRRRFVAIVAANQTLQRAFRCHQARRQLAQLRTEAAAAKLQRAFRCHLARVRVAELRAVEQQAAAMDVDDLGGGGCDDADQREADQLEAERANAERLADQQRDVDLVAIAQLAADTETKRARGVRSFPPAEVVYANLQSLRKEATQLREAAEVAYEAGREALYDRFPAFAPNSADSQLRNSANVSDAMASVPRDRKRKADKEAKKAAKKEANASRQLQNQIAHANRKRREEERKLEELRRERDRLQALVAAKAVNPRDNKNSMGTEPDPENDILPAGARRLKAPTSFKRDCTSLADDTPQPQPRKRQTLKARSSSAPAPTPASAAVSSSSSSSSSSVYTPCFKLTLDEKSRIARDLALLTPEFLAKLYQIIRDFPMLFSGGQNQPTPSGICLSQDQDEKDICVCLPDDVQKTTIPGIMFIFTAYLTGDQCDDPASIQAFFAAVEYHVDRILN